MLDRDIDARLAQIERKIDSLCDRVPVDQIDPLHPLKRLARIERKVNYSLAILYGGVAIGVGYVANRFVENDLGLGHIIGGIAFLAAGAAWLHYMRRDFES